MPTGNIFIAVHNLNWLESEEGKKKKKKRKWNVYPND